MFIEAILGLTELLGSKKLLLLWCLPSWKQTNPWPRWWLLPSSRSEAGSDCQRQKHLQPLTEVAGAADGRGTVLKHFHPKSLPLPSQPMLPAWRLPGGRLHPTQFQTHVWATIQTSKYCWQFLLQAGDKHRPELWVHAWPSAQPGPILPSAPPSMISDNHAQ